MVPLADLQQETTSWRKSGIQLALSLLRVKPRDEMPTLKNHFEKDFGKLKFPDTITEEPALI